MRAIDNMTPQEIETLDLKGMLADNKAKPVLSAMLDASESFADPAPNKAQPQHSPLPWSAKDSEREMLRLNNRLIKVEAHADKLAEALRDCLELGVGDWDGEEPSFVKKSRETLAAYEAAQ